MKEREPQTVLEALPPSLQLTTRADYAAMKTANPALLYLSQCAPSAVKGQRAALEELARRISGGRCGMLELAWHELRYAHIAALRAVLAKVERSQATARRKFAAIRSTLHAAYNAELLSTESWMRIKEVKTFKTDGHRAGRALSADEIRLLIDSCRSGDALGLRDGALLALLFGASMRREEAAKLLVKNWDPRERTLLIRGSLSGGGGKGNREREAEVAPGAARLLNDWLGKRAQPIPATAPLVCGFFKGGRPDEMRPLTGNGIWRALVARGLRAGVAHFSPHDLRRSAVTLVIETTGDIDAAKEMAGHASITSTEIYNRRRKKLAARKAVDSLPFPEPPPAPTKDDDEPPTEEPT